jgi:hypothetical protein
MRDSGRVRGCGWQLKAGGRDAEKSRYIQPAPGAGPALGLFESTGRQTSSAYCRRPSACHFQSLHPCSPCLRWQEHAHASRDRPLWRHLHLPAPEPISFFETILLGATQSFEGSTLSPSTRTSSTFSSTRNISSLLSARGAGIVLYICNAKFRMVIDF